MLKLFNILKRTPKFKTIFLFLEILWKKVLTFDIDQRAAAVSFSFMLAVFPGIIFLFTLIPFVPIDNFDGQIMEFLKNILPKGIYATAERTISDIVSRKRGDVLSFGFLFTVFAATNGTMAFMRAFNIALNKNEKRTFLEARGYAFLLTFILIFVLISAIVILIGIKLIITFLFMGGLFTEKINVFFLNLVSYLSIFFIFFGGISSLYYFGPEVSKKISFFSMGSFFASIMSILITNLFGFYLVNFSTYNKLYGSIGTLIGLMVWFYLISLIIILGFEINISLRETKKIGKKNELPLQ